MVLYNKVNQKYQKRQGLHKKIAIFQIVLQLQGVNYSIIVWYILSLVLQQHQPLKDKN